MKVLVIDQYGLLLDWSMRAQGYGHQVRHWMPPRHDGGKLHAGDGYVSKVTSYEPSMRWADLILVGDCARYTRTLDKYVKLGFPIFGYTKDAARLELDRGHGQEICHEYGMSIVPYEVFNSWNDAIKFVESTMGTYVCKPWGGTEDKSLSYVSSSPEDMVYHLLKQKSKGRLAGQIMIQQKITGIEMAVGGWFGKAGWSQWVCENFEEKKFMNDNLGQNTGEQGTILRYVQSSKLFEECLEPVTAHLTRCGYVGYVDMNTMVRGKAPAAPLEFTSRFGYPLNNIQRALHMGDEAIWMAGLLEGKDLLKVREGEVAVGVELTHGTFPHNKQGDESATGCPLYGITDAMMPHLHFEEVMWGEAPMKQGNGINCHTPMPVTAGCSLMTVTGTGATVREAQAKAYERIWKIKPPTNRMFRTDIGDRLKAQLPELQANGYATGMRF